MKAVMANEPVPSGATQSVGFVARMKGYYHEIVSEMSKVAWPTQDEVKASTAIVFLLCAVLSVVIAVLDIFFRNFVVLAFSLF